MSGLPASIAAYMLTVITLGSIGEYLRITGSMNGGRNGTNGLWVHVMERPTDPEVVSHHVLLCALEYLEEEEANRAVSTRFRCVYAVLFNAHVYRTRCAWT